MGQSRPKMTTMPRGCLSTSHKIILVLGTVSKVIHHCRSQVDGSSWHIRGTVGGSDLLDVTGWAKVAPTAGRLWPGSFCFLILWQWVISRNAH